MRHVRAARTAPRERRPFQALIAAAGLYLALSLIFGAVFVDRALHRPRRAVSAADRARAEALARAVDARLDDASVAAGDGAILHGDLFTPARFGGHSVVLLHGIVSNRASMLPTARLFLEHGYRVLAVDARAHGESGGTLVTFGALERDDLARWIASVRGLPGSCVYLFGGSQGGSYALQASDAPGVCAVVSVSADASLREIAFDRIGERLHTGPWIGRSLLRPGVELGFLYARMRYGVKLSDASALASVIGAGAPILAIHGTDDAITPVRHARLIAAANPARVSLWLVRGGSHAPGGAEPVEFPRRMLAFFDEHRVPWQ